MKSEGVKDIVKWMEKEIKEQKEIMKNYQTSCDPEIETARLNQMVEWKISIEKYMKKLRHQGE